MVYVTMHNQKTERSEVKMGNVEEMIETFRSSKEGVLQSCQEYLRCAQSLMHDYVRDNGLNKMPYELELATDLLGKVDSNIDLVVTLLSDEERHSTK